LRALAAAWDAGITFYDTARSYGYGESEALLGEFLRTRRDQAIISTKFGILPARQQLWKRAAKPVARALLSLAPSSRNMLRKQVAGQFTPNQFTVGVLEQSIHESLRKLKTDYVDFLFMHDAPASVLHQDELLAKLDQLVASGKVRVAGISAAPEVIGLVLREHPKALRALQFPCNVFDLSTADVAAAAKGSGLAAVANHPFGGVTRVEQSRAILKNIASSSSTPAELRAKLETVDDAVLADVVLNIILSSPGIHVVVPAMMKPSHLNNNVNAVAKSRFTSDEIRLLYQHVAAVESVA
jgi:aryl-alcohol dehydrogenase-like predicted oxidoreductase